MSVETDRYAVKPPEEQERKKERRRIMFSRFSSHPLLSSLISHIIIHHILHKHIHKYILHKLQINVYTSNIRGGGTEANVLIKLYSDEGAIMGPLKLRNKAARFVFNSLHLLIPFFYI